MKKESKQGRKKERKKKRKKKRMDDLSCGFFYPEAWKSGQVADIRTPEGNDDGYRNT